MNSKTNEKNMEINCTKQESTPNIRWMLVGYDLIVYAIVALILQHVFWVKFMDKYGDMVEFSVISACCLLILSLL